MASSGLALSLVVICCCLAISRHVASVSASQVRTTLRVLYCYVYRLLFKPSLSCDHGSLYLRSWSRSSVSSCWHGAPRRVVALALFLGKNLFSHGRSPVGRTGAVRSRSCGRERCRGRATHSSIKKWLRLSSVLISTPLTFQRSLSPPTSSSPAASSMAGAAQRTTGGPAWPHLVPPFLTLHPHRQRVAASVRGDFASGVVRTTYPSRRLRGVRDEDEQIRAVQPATLEQQCTTGRGVNCK